MQALLFPEVSLVCVLLGGEVGVAIFQAGAEGAFSSRRALAWPLAGANLWSLQ